VTTALAPGIVEEGPSGPDVAGTEVSTGSTEGSGAGTETGDGCVCEDGNADDEGDSEADAAGDELPLAHFVAMTIAAATMTRSTTATVTLRFIQSG
jgi:hypothetical protein